MNSKRTSFDEQQLSESLREIGFSNERIEKTFFDYDVMIKKIKEHTNWKPSFVAERLKNAVDNNISQQSWLTLFELSKEMEEADLLPFEYLDEE